MKDFGNSILKMAMLASVLAAFAFFISSIHVNAQNATINSTSLSVIEAPTSSLSAYLITNLTGSNEITSTSQNNMRVFLGQNVLVTVNPSGGTLPYTYQWYLNSNPVGTNFQAFDFLSNSSALSTGTSTLTAVVTDSESPSATFSVNVLITVIPLPTITFSKGSATNSIKVTATLPSSAGTSGSVFNYSYDFYFTNNYACTGLLTPSHGKSTGSGSSNSILYTPSIPPYNGNCVLNVTVNETHNGNDFSNNYVSGNGTAYSQVINFTKPFNVSINPNVSHISIGSNVLLTANAQGGIPSYTYQWKEGANTLSTSDAFDFSGTSANIGINLVNVIVTDSYGTTTTNSALVYVSNPNFKLSNDIVSPEIANKGQYVQVTSQESGGTSPFNSVLLISTRIGNSYSQVPSNDVTCNSISNTIDCQLNTNSILPNVYVFEVQTTDATGDMATSPVNTNANGILTLLGPVSLNVTPLTSYITANSATPATLIAAILNNTGSVSYSYQWYNDTTGTGIPVNSATTNTLKVYGETIGTFVYYAVATPASGTALASNKANVIVSQVPPLQVSISPPSTPIQEGQNVTLVASASGGTTPYSYVWKLGSTTFASTTNTLVFYGNSSDIGTDVVNLTVTDSANRIATSQSVISVSSTSTTTTIGSSGGGGGGGGAAPSGGGGGGGGAPPVSIVNSCASVTDFASYQQVNFILDGEAFNLVNNFITPTTAGVSVNGAPFTLSIDNATSAASGNRYNFMLNLTNISYLPIQHTITVKLCAVSQNTVPRVPPYSLNLNLTSNEIILTTSNSSDFLELMLNGNVVATGMGGSIFYYTYGLKPGFYNVTGKDTAANQIAGPDMYVKPGIKPSLTIVNTCKSFTYNGLPCKSTFSIITYNSQLIGTLYLNNKLVGMTNSVISNTVNAPGTYTYTFNVLGDANYTSNSISYTFTIRHKISVWAYVAIAAVIIVAGFLVYQLVWKRRDELFQ